MLWTSIYKSGWRQHMGGIQMSQQQFAEFYFFPYCELFWKLYRETYLRDRWAIREWVALSTFSLNGQIFC